MSLVHHMTRSASFEEKGEPKRNETEVSVDQTSKQALGSDQLTRIFELKIILKRFVLNQIYNFM